MTCQYHLWQQGGDHCKKELWLVGVDFAPTSGALVEGRVVNDVCSNEESVHLFFSLFTFMLSEDYHCGP
jgi:hypothetical protein